MWDNIKWLEINLMFNYYYFYLFSIFKYILFYFKSFYLKIGNCVLIDDNYKKVENLNL